MNWLLANPILSGAAVLLLILLAACGVQTYRLAMTQAELKLSEADNAVLKSEVRVQSSRVRAWAMQAADARERANAMLIEADKFREQRDTAAKRIAAIKLPANECAALAMLVDAHRK